MIIDGVDYNFTEEQIAIIQHGARYADWDIVDGQLVQYDHGGMTSSQIIKELETQHQYLDDTDYKAIKFFEGAMTEEEFAPIRTARQAARDRINELEALLESRS